MDSKRDVNDPPVVNALGLLCPLPIVHTARRLKDLPPGAVVEVRSDDPGIRQDLPAWCRAMNHELISLEECEGVWRGRVRKGGAETRASAAPS